MHAPEYRVEFRWSANSFETAIIVPSSSCIIMSFFENHVYDFAKTHMREGGIAKRNMPGVLVAIFQKNATKNKKKREEFSVGSVEILIDDSRVRILVESTGNFLVSNAMSVI